MLNATPLVLQRCVVARGTRTLALRVPVRAVGAAAASVLQLPQEITAFLCRVAGDTTDCSHITATATAAHNRDRHRQGVSRAVAIAVKARCAVYNPFLKSWVSTGLIVPARRRANLGDVTPATQPARPGCATVIVPAGRGGRGYGSVVLSDEAIPPPTPNS
jgi:hypothetical protein